MIQTRTQLRVPSVISFLSFLDILFATIGVFIVVLTVQLLALKDRAPISPDALIVLKPYGEHLWYRDAGTPTPVRQQLLGNALGLADELAASLRRPVRVVVAFSFDAVGKSLQFEELIRDRWSGRPQAPGKSGADTAVPWVRFAWRPLESADFDGAKLAKRLFEPAGGKPPP
ncbi:MAG: hypothetical protein ACREC6_10025 [Hyphomicrobiaceae bacterium]